MKELQSGTAKLKEDYDPFFDDPTSLFNLCRAENERERKEEELNGDIVPVYTSSKKFIIEKVSTCSPLEIAGILDTIFNYMTAEELQDFSKSVDNTTDAIIESEYYCSDFLTPDERSFVKENNVIRELVEHKLGHSICRGED